MKKHVNIPVFIPHYGCPNACVFCNQKKITGKPSYSKDSVISEIEDALSTVDTDVTEVELAFFGGSFTAIPQDELNNLEHNLRMYIEMHQTYERTFAGVLNGYLEMLPKNIEAVKEIMSKFNPEDFKAVIDFAKAANGGRPIN